MPICGSTSATENSRMNDRTSGSIAGSAGAASCTATPSASAEGKRSSERLERHRITASQSGGGSSGLVIDSGIAGSVNSLVIIACMPGASTGEVPVSAKYAVAPSE